MQIGAVIDAIPRLIRATNGQFIVVTFSFVNVYATEVNAIYDGATNVVGENVEEGQYNTAFSAIVENLMDTYSIIWYLSNRLPAFAGHQFVVAGQLFDFLTVLLCSTCVAFYKDIVSKYP